MAVAGLIMGYYAIQLAVIFSTDATGSITSKSFVIGGVAAFFVLSPLAALPWFAANQLKNRNKMWPTFIACGFSALFIVPVGTILSAYVLFELFMYSRANKSQQEGSNNVDAG